MTSQSNFIGRMTYFFLLYQFNVTLPSSSGFKSSVQSSISNFPQSFFLFLCSKPTINLQSSKQWIFQTSNQLDSIQTPTKICESLNWQCKYFFLKKNKKTTIAATIKLISDDQELTQLGEANQEKSTFINSKLNQYKTLQNLKRGNGFKQKIKRKMTIVQQDKTQTKYKSQVENHKTKHIMKNNLGSKKQKSKIQKISKISAKKPIFIQRIVQKQVKRRNLQTFQKTKITFISKFFEIIEYHYFDRLSVSSQATQILDLKFIEQLMAKRKERQIAKLAIQGIRSLMYIKVLFLDLVNVLKVKVKKCFNQYFVVLILNSSFLFINFICEKYKEQIRLEQINESSDHSNQLNSQNNIISLVFANSSKNQQNINLLINSIFQQTESLANYNFTPLVLQSLTMNLSLIDPIERGQDLESIIRQNQLLRLANKRITQLIRYLIDNFYHKTHKLNPNFSLNLDLSDINQATLEFISAFDKHINSSVQQIESAMQAALEQQRSANLRLQEKIKQYQKTISEMSLIIQKLQLELHDKKEQIDVLRHNASKLKISLQTSEQNQLKWQSRYELIRNQLQSGRRYEVIDTIDQNRFSYF